MAKEYGIIEEKQEQPKFPVRTLVRVPHQDIEGGIIVTRNAFGPNYFRKNVAEMQGRFCYPNTREVITFREPTTSESISAVAYDFKNIAKPEIFDPRWLQAGWIVRTSDGVYANPPKDENGVPITDEIRLIKLRDKAKKVNGIWVLENTEELVRKGIRDFGFASYETFDRQKDGIDSVAFAKGGLARILEHTQGKFAEKLQQIASPENYPLAVSVWGFEEVIQPIARVVCLDSSRNASGGRLYVSGYDWDDCYGCASGVFKASTEGASIRNQQ